MNHRAACSPPFRRLLAAALAALFLPAAAHALGLGEIRVKSSYNRGFVAEIPVYLEADEGDIKAEPGSQSDYNMVQIGRPAFIDSLAMTVENGPQGKIIVVRSKEPITQPSFNLIIRASASGGTVLENYFLAVDFRKTLSLDLPPPEEHAAEAPKPEAVKEEAVSMPLPPPLPVPVVTPPLPASAAPAADQKADAETEEALPPPPAPVPAPPAPAPMTPKEPASEKKAAPAPQKETEKAPVEEAPPVEAPAAAPVMAPLIVAKSEEPAPAEQKEATMAETAEAAAEPEATPVEPASRSIYPAVARVDRDPQKNRVKVKRGDTLFNIARRLHPGKQDLARVVVAIYRDNKDAFIGGNIHRLRSGEKLDYNNVNDRAAAISDEEARRILAKGFDEEIPAESGAALAAAAMPLETPVPAQEIADFVEQWRAAWEAGLPSYADCYAASFGGFQGRFRRATTKDEWLASRHAFNEAHDDRAISVADMKIVRSGASITVYFTQTFSSDQLFSVGQKRLSLVQEEGRLGIAEERFTADRADDRTHSWTVILATVQSRTVAGAHIARLRELGFPAYETGGRPENGAYTVAVGRLASRAMAATLAEKLKTAGERDSKVVRLPFSIKVKSTDDPAEAAATMAALAGNGYAPFQVETVREGKARQTVCVGAFATRAEAAAARDAIIIEGLEPQTALP